MSCANLWILTVPLCALLVFTGCPMPNDDGSHDTGSGQPDSGNATDTGSSTDTGDTADTGTPTGEEGGLMLPPDQCQTDLRVLRTEDFEERDHPLTHKDMYWDFRNVVTADGTVGAVVELGTDTAVFLPGTAYPGTTEDWTMSPRFSRYPAVAPDFGADNDPDFPVAMHGIIHDDTFSGTSFVAYSSGLATPVPGFAIDTPIIGNLGSYTVQGIGELEMSGTGTLVAQVTVETGPPQQDALVVQAGPGAALVARVEPGASLSTTGDVRVIGGIQRFEVKDGGAIDVQVTVLDGTGTMVGKAVLDVDLFTGITSCVATDTDIDCGGVFASAGSSIDPFEVATDSGSYGVVVRDGSSAATLHYKVPALASPATLARDDMLDGQQVLDVRRVRTCSRENAVFAAVDLWANDGIGMVSELVRFDADGVHKLTDFRAWLGVASVEGEVPDEIRDFAVGPHCDAVLYTWGPSGPDSNLGYEGYWAVYDDGDTVEIIDETGGRPNGNGAFTSVSRGRTGLDPNADEDARVFVGPDGTFHFISVFVDSNNVSTWNYVEATPPVNRCREPYAVNVTTDEADAAPGDGRCDTGTTTTGGDPACTLRAALQEANAQPGKDKVSFEPDLAGASITVESALPPVTSQLELEGVSGVVIDGSTAGQVDGLDIRMANSTLRDVEVRGFGGDGIVASAEVDLVGVVSHANGGWGARFEDFATVERGAFTANADGGIWTRSSATGRRDLRLSGFPEDPLRASGNGGPGILAEGTVSLLSVDIDNNSGEGVLLPARDGFLGTRLQLDGGPIAITNNGGHGVRIEDGHLTGQYAQLELTDNCGWGLLLDQGIARLRNGTLTVERNGLGTTGEYFDLVNGEVVGTAGDCAGGGVGIWGVVANGFDETAILESGSFRDNGGPGIASTAFVRLLSAFVDGNAGPGILTADPELEATEQNAAVHFTGTSTVSDNAGDGVHVASGSIDVTGDLTVIDNAGAGLRSDSGHLWVNRDATASASTSVRRNGVTGSCVPWTHADATGWSGGSAASCVYTDGLVAEAGDITGQFTVIRDNGGAGVRAADPGGDGYGIVTLSNGELCDNGSADVAEQLNLTNMTCP